MTLDRVFANIQLTEKIFRKLIVTSNYKKISNAITWENYSTGIFKNLYAKEYEVLIKKRQYSFLLSEDKGFIQFYFDFENGSLRKIKMAYYPHPIHLNENKEEFENYTFDADDELITEYYFDVWNILNHQFELSLPDEALKEYIKKSKEVGNDETPSNLILGKFETKYKFTNSSHLRIDYDSTVTTHHKCEIQMGAINNIRLPVQKVIMPFLFFDFIAKNIFPEEYKEICKHQHYKTNYTISKAQSLDMNPFTEDNIFTMHD